MSVERAMHHDNVLLLCITYGFNSLFTFYPSSFSKISILKGTVAPKSAYLKKTSEPAKIGEHE